MAVEMICMFGQYTCQPPEHFDSNKVNPGAVGFFLETEPRVTLICSLLMDGKLPVYRLSENPK